MADIEKVKQGIKSCWSEHWCHKCIDCPYKPDRDNDNTCVERLGADALELLKEHKKIKEQLEELQIMENSKVKECDSYCDWDAKHYHQGRLDAYSIALAGFNQKD